jgi:hypothetical protein
MASTELLSDTRSRSEAEVEQILPFNEHVPDPRDFYASDSPVLEYNIASDQELYESAEEFSGSRGPEVQDDRQVGNRFAGPCVCWPICLIDVPNWYEILPAASDRTAPASACPTIHYSLPAFVISADLTSPTTNDFCSATLMS